MIPTESQWPTNELRWSQIIIIDPEQPPVISSDLQRLRMIPNNL